MNSRAWFRLMVFLLLGARLGVGQDVANLRRDIDRLVAQPASPLRDSLLCERYLATSKSYQWVPTMLDSTLFFARKAAEWAVSPRQKAFAMLHRGYVHFNAEWGFHFAREGFDDVVMACRMFCQLRDREGFRESLNALTGYYQTAYNLENRYSEKTLRTMMQALAVQHDPAFRFPTTFSATPDDGPAQPQTYRQALAAARKNLAYWTERGSRPHQLWRSEIIGILSWDSDLDKPGGLAMMKRAAWLADSLGKEHFFTHAACLNRLCQWNRELGHHRVALAYANEGLTLSRNARQVTREAFFYDQLYLTHKALGQYETAFRFKEKNLRILDSLTRLGDQKQVELLRRQGLAQARQLELERQVARERQRQNWAFAGAGALMLVGGLLGWSNRRLQQKNRLLATKNAEISTALLQGQTLERRRVAADLHDSLGGLLSSLRWQMQQVDEQTLDEKQRGIFRNTLQNLTDAYQRVRLISHNLLPEDFEKQGLTKGLAHLAGTLNRAGGIQIDLEITGLTERLPRQTEFELYSIALELLTNVLKHADATEAFLGLERQNGRIHLTVSDNGRGWNGEMTDGKGWLNVRDRVASLHGTVQVRPRTGQGTEVAIEVPV